LKRWLKERRSSTCTVATNRTETSGGASKEECFWALLASGAAEWIAAKRRFQQTQEI
jgi:hypothetical protein